MFNRQTATTAPPAGSDVLPHLCRRNRQRHRERHVSGPSEPGERAEPGRHGGRGLGTAGPEASESRVVVLVQQSPWQPQEEEEQEQTQVQNPQQVLTGPIKLDPAAAQNPLRLIQLEGLNL